MIGPCGAAGESDANARRSPMRSAANAGPFWPARGKRGAVALTAAPAAANPVGVMNCPMAPNETAAGDAKALSTDASAASVFVGLVKWPGPVLSLHAAARTAVTAASARTNRLADMQCLRAEHPRLVDGEWNRDGADQVSTERGRGGGDLAHANFAVARVPRC